MSAFVMDFSFMGIMEMTGTVAFAISGALVAVRKKMDLFGVNILAVITAVGGGILRDVLVGEIPPNSFRNPFYAVLAMITANVVFCWLLWYRNHRKWGRKDILSKKVISRYYDLVLFWMDTFGLAAFTVSGVSVGIGCSDGSNWFLSVFLGVVTGVGGGVLRDVLANEMPYVFVKHVYAVASLAGAGITVAVWEQTGGHAAVIAGFGVTLVMRILAAHFEWELPKIIS